MCSASAEKRHDSSGDPPLVAGTSITQPLLDPPPHRLSHNGGAVRQANGRAMFYTLRAAPTSARKSSTPKHIRRRRCAILWQFEHSGIRSLIGCGVSMPAATDRTWCTSL
jgi:hypothetical protein